MKLFEPIKIGNMEVRNRIVMAAMGTRGLCELDGRFNQRGIDYLAARAQGGVGLITTGSIPLNVVESNLADGWSFRPRADNLVFVARLNELTETIHHYGSKINGQLMPGFGRVGHMTVTTRPIAPSPVPFFWNPKIICREITQEEITAIIKAVGNAAKILKMADFDAIELNGHMGYILDQFKTALWNKRTDKYGGDLDGRMRFPLEVIQEIKNNIGDTLPIIYKIATRHDIEGGRELEETQEIVRRLEAAGVAAFEVDAGCYESYWWPHPSVYQPAGCMVEDAAAIKKVVKVPVIAVGKLDKPEVAEKALQEGKADLIAIGRGLLADPNWANKVKQGRLDDICPCISDYDGCSQRVVFQARTMGCTVNPQVAHEKDYAITRAEKARRVLVVGGGPAGLEAARVAALRGHQVTLWEKNSRLGGNLLPASAPPFKSDLRYLINYLSTQIEKLGVAVKLGKEATVQSIGKTNPDVVILATGATSLIPPIPGTRGKNTVTAIDLLMDGSKIKGEQILVIGGGIIGCETAVYLAQKGKKVTILEMMPKLLPADDLFLSNKEVLMQMFDASRVASITGAKVKTISETGITVEVNGAMKDMSADLVVLAAGLTPESRLSESLKGSPFEVFAIGDCVKPRKIINAIWEGFHTSRLV